MSDIKKTGVLREVPPEWDELMNVTAGLTGNIKITFNQGRPVVIEEAVKKVSLDQGTYASRKDSKTTPRVFRLH